MSDSESNVPRSRRVLILPAAAIVIFGLTAWRMTHPRQSHSAAALPQMKRPAPDFQLYEQGSERTKSRVVKLSAYLGRHTIVLVFFDGQKGPEADPTLQHLREMYPALRKEGIVVMGISTALPQDNRRNSTHPFPFALLSDVTATATQSVHKTWGRFREPPSLDQPAGTQPGVFVIDRSGMVPWSGDSPEPDAHPETIVARLLRE